jgi:hypothetical protein
MGVPGYTCMWCKERSSVKGAVNWLLNLPLALLMLQFPYDGYCERCGNRLNFVGLLSWVILAGAVFLFVVIKYG